VLLFSLHNDRIFTSLGMDTQSFVRIRMVVDTGAGPNLVLWAALDPDLLRQVVASKEEEQVHIRDANSARLRTSGTVTLRLQTHSSSSKTCRSRSSWAAHSEQSHQC